MGIFLKKIIRIFIVLTMAPAIHHAAAREPAVRIDGQTLTLKVDGIPLRWILKEISSQGIIVRVDPEIDPLVTASFDNRDLQEAFRQVVKGYNHALVWKKGDNGDPVLSKIVIYNQGGMGRASPIKSPSALTIEKNPITGAIYVKNKILVRFKKPISAGQIQAVAKSLNASIVLVHEGQGLYEITLPDDTNTADAMAVLEKENRVETVEPDYAYRSPDLVRYGDTGWDTQQHSPHGHPDGSAPVAVLDSGLNPDFLSRDLNQASFNALSPEDTISDASGHGTQMALIASGKIKPMGAESDSFSNPVVSVRAFDENGYTSNSVLIRGIDFAVEKGAKVLSLSWGSETDSRFLEMAVAYAGSKGMVVVAAAGNSPTGKPVYPAAYDAVISVSALAPDGSAWDRSNFGEFVDTAAPGFARLPIGHNGDPGTYAGTSISTAYIAGRLAAYLRDNPDAVINIRKRKP